MNYRTLGKTGFKVSEIGFGGWAIGADWGQVTEKDALKALHAAIDHGVNFIDTADVYGDGRSEKIIRKLLSERKEKIFVATKAGRRLNPHRAEGYTSLALNDFVDRSRDYLGIETIDLLQLHCPPTPVYYTPQVFEVLDEMVRNKKIKYYGVSVEKVEEALKTIEYPGVSTIQIIYNMFRQRPSELFFNEAQKRNIGIIVRVPLASGLLTGKMTPKTKFDTKDHRNFNREGKAFDVGETFAGVPYEKGLAAVEKIKKILPEGMELSQLALRWILMQSAVSTIIPGGKSPNQVEMNVKASALKPLTEGAMQKIKDIYEKNVKTYVHHRW